MSAEQEHGGRWDGFGPEPKTDAEWRAHLREISDGDLEEICNCPFDEQRFDAQDERVRRRDLQETD